MKSRNPNRPIVIAHRGASGYRPEHTLAAYEMAIDLGADYVEPDLVSTRDGILVARHENEISGTTDVALRPEFASRKTTKVIDGFSITGWFTEDFSLAELKTLRARERLPQLRPRNTSFDGLYEIPTLREVIDLVKRRSGELGRAIGIYPETKHPTYFESIGLPLEQPLLRMLEETRVDAVYIQSFEERNLRKLRRMTRLPLIHLLSSFPPDVERITEYADGIGPDKNLVIPRDDANNLLSPTTLVDDAHAAGLMVHAWAFRNESYFLPNDFRDDPEAEYKRFFELGIDGVFSDHPDTAVRVRNQLGR